jgi:hypothetical protein
MIGNIYEGRNYLTDDEAIAFTGAPNIESIESAFSAAKNIGDVSINSFQEYPDIRYWDVLKLCKVYSIDPYESPRMINDLKKAGLIDGDLVPFTA